MNKDRPFDPNETIVEHLQTHIEISPRQPHLVLFIGPDSGKRFKLKPGQMTIGRTPKADITIDDEWASRIHAIIEWTDEVIQIIFDQCHVSQCCWWVWKWVLKRLCRRHSRTDTPRHWSPANNEDENNAKLN